MAIINVEAGDIVIFFDKYCDQPIHEGRNQVAFLIDEYHALYFRKNWVRSISLKKLFSSTNIEIRQISDQNLKSLIAAFFKKNRFKPSYFYGGMGALLNHNYQPFETGDFFPIRRTYKNQNEYENAWNTFISKLQPGDCIFTVSDQFISKFIAWSTRGKWSHVAMHIGNGEIVESTVPKIRRCSIEAYKGQKHWIAIYRHIQTLNEVQTEDKWHSIANEIYKGFKDGYNYRKAIYFGWKSFKGDHSHNLVPNSSIYQGVFRLIEHV